MQPDNTKAGLFPPNPMGKQRRDGEAYLTFRSDGWTWQVLKSWQKNNAKPFARWYCYVTTPFNTSGDLGDTYVADVMGNSTLEEWDHSVFGDNYIDVVRYLKESGAYDATAAW